MIEITIRAEEGEWTQLLKQFLEELQGLKGKEAPKVQHLAPSQTYTLEAIRTQVYALCEQGKRQAVLKLLAQYGTQRLTELRQEDYASFMERVGEIV